MEASSLELVMSSEVVSIIGCLATDKELHVVKYLLPGQFLVFVHISIVHEVVSFRLGSIKILRRNPLSNFVLQCRNVSKNRCMLTIPTQ